MKELTTTASLLVGAYTTSIFNDISPESTILIGGGMAIAMLTIFIQRKTNGE